FLKVIDLPRRTAQPFELALGLKGGGKGPDGWIGLDDEDAAALRQLADHGWRVIDGMALSQGAEGYRDYVGESLAEFTVAKDQNVRLRSGWFSDRSACYLAAGRPVVTQDTAFGKFVPTGEGLFAFRSLEDATEAIRAIAGDYDRHGRAALAVAQEYFRAETVLARLLADAGF